jgi:hypothetical protein
MVTNLHTRHYKALEACGQRPSSLCIDVNALRKGPRAPFDGAQGDTHFLIGNKTTEHSLHRGNPLILRIMVTLA